MADTSYTRLQKRVQILEAAIDLQADPENALKRAKLEALLEPTVTDAFTKALGRPASTNLIPLLHELRKSKPRGPEHFVNVERGRKRAEELRQEERAGIEKQKARLNPDGRSLKP